MCYKTIIDHFRLKGMPQTLKITNFWKFLVFAHISLVAIQIFKFFLFFFTFSGEIMVSEQGSNYVLTQSVV